MSRRAEELALKIYPKNEIKLYGPLEGASGPTIFDDNRSRRVGFIRGYDKCLEDTRLTAEDVSCIIHLADRFGKDYQKIADTFNKDREDEE